MDNHCGHALSTTKIIKSKALPNLDLENINDRITRYLLGTQTFKVFNDVEYKDLVTGYNHKKKIYHMIYEDGDNKYFYHNEVKKT